jgi:hypothetical protein
MTEPKYCNECGGLLVFRKEFQEDLGFDRATEKPIERWAIYAVCREYDKGKSVLRFSWLDHDHFIVRSEDGTQWPVPARLETFIKP